MRKDFEKQLPQFKFTEVSQSDIDGNSIFTNLNTSYSDSEKTLQLTTTAHDDSRDVILNGPLAYRWWFKDKNGQNIYIIFYDLRSEETIYRINGNTLSDNIITVQLQSKGD